MNENIDQTSVSEHPSGVSINIIPVYPESGDPDYDYKVHSSVPIISEHHSVDDALKAYQLLEEPEKYRFGLSDSTGEDVAFVNKDDLAGMFEAMAADAIKTRMQNKHFNIHTMERGLYEKLDKSIRAEGDDIIALGKTVQSLSFVYPALSEAEIKIAAEEVLYSVRDNVSSEIAEALHSNPAQICEYLADVELNIVDLSQHKMSTPDEFSQSSLVQGLRRSLETLKQLEHTLTRDQYLDKELGIRNPESIFNEFSQLVSETWKAGTSILNNAHSEAHAAQYAELVSSQSEEKNERYSKLTKAVLSAESEHEALTEIDMYNEWYCGGELDIHEVYQNIRNENDNNEPTLADVSHDSNIYKTIAPVVEAKRLLNSKAELFTAISEAEANLSSYNISKELGFDTKVTEDLRDKLEFSLPVISSIKAIISTQPEKYSISADLMKDISKMHTEMRSALELNKYQLTDKSSNNQDPKNSVSSKAITSKMR